MILLDTNVVSELRRPERTHPNVAAWITAAPTASLMLSAMTVLELEIGMRRIARRDERQGTILRAWVDRVLAAFEGRILPFDTAVARRCAALHVPDPRPERDAIIAATALVHGLTLATRNVRDFDGTGARVVDPWAESPSIQPG